jgi:hypothetical protein
MGLTQEQLIQVRRALRLAEMPPAAKDDPPGKRNSARWSVDAIVGFAACRGPNAATVAAAAGIADAGAVEPAAKWVNLIDLSPTGASVLSRTQFAPGEHFVLALPAEGEEHLPAVCLVQYSRVKLDGTFRIGAQFCEVADAGEANVKAALAAMKDIGLYVIDPAHAAAAAARAADPSAAAARPAQPRPAQSQRRSERRMAEGRAVIHTYDEMGEPGPIEEVPALDFSETGVCIFRREPMKVGDHFMARVPVLNAPPIISLCRVTNVLPCEGEHRFRIGAEFVRPAGFTTKLFRALFGWLKAA